MNRKEKTTVTLSSRPCSEHKQKSSRKLWKEKLKKSEGLGTLEIVIIIAVLLAVALLFREQITAFAEDLMARVFDSSILDQIG